MKFKTISALMITTIIILGLVIFYLEKKNIKKGYWHICNYKTQLTC